MTEERFHKWIEQSKNLPKKLQLYHHYVYKLLDAHPYLSAAQIEDRLKEEFSDLPVVHSKTVYNFTESIRARYGIKKQPDKEPRQYEKLPEPDYGAYAQVDFGQYNMLTQGGMRKKVYFFVMVLCRSRQKFVYLQSTPFTTEHTVLAHQKAFHYYEGQPQKIIYDQDRVLIVDENLGDVLLTEQFKSYIGQAGFKAIFCRKADPESKGKVENAVKYVKYNLLRGRVYMGDDHLNKTAFGWLQRTANGKEHAGTKQVPHEQWLNERKYLQPVNALPSQEQIAMARYKVRKDNTISYKSNFYTLPLGTYQSPDAWVLLKEDEDQVRIYDLNNYLLTVHPLCLSRGMTLRNADHTRDKSQSIEALKETVLQILPSKEKGKLLIELILQDKPRYLRDNLLILKKHLTDFEPDIVNQVIDFCLERNVCNTNRFVEIARYYTLQKEQERKIKPMVSQGQLTKENTRFGIEPKRSQISFYETIL
jgi:hypothetical protein